MNIITENEGEKKKRIMNDEDMNVDSNPANIQEKLFYVLVAIIKL